MDLQAYIDGLSAQWQRERSETQMTLGKLIEALQEMPDGAEVSCLVEPHSYRGYYSDIAFEIGAGKRLASELLEECKASMGQIFQGYKGGDYVMGALTPVWVADYGSCGKKLMAISDNGEIETADDE